MTLHSIGRSYVCCPLVNATDLLTQSSKLSWPVGASELRSYFSPFVDRSYQIMSARSLQRRFPIVDVLFLSGDIRDRSAKSSEIAPKHVFRLPIFLEEDP